MLLILLARAPATSPPRSPTMTDSPDSIPCSATRCEAFGDGPDVWLRMQAAYDAWHASRKVDVSKVSRLAA